MLKYFQAEQNGISAELLSYMTNVLQPVEDDFMESKIISGNKEFIEN